MNEKLLRFVREEEGIEVVEWAIIIGLIAVTSLAAIIGLAAWVNGKLNELSTGVQGS